MQFMNIHIRQQKMKGDKRRNGYSDLVRWNSIQLWNILQSIFTFYDNLFKSIAVVFNLQTYIKARSSRSKL